MSEFKREHRYHVLKIAHLTPGQQDQLAELLGAFYDQSVDPLVEAVVVERDWPIYEQTWEAVQRLAEGRIQELDELRANAAERERLKIELAAALGYDSPHPSMCDLVVEAGLLREERDALAVHIQQLSNIAEKICTVAPEYLDHLASDAAFVLHNKPKSIGSAALSNCPDCEGSGNIAFVTCPTCDGAGKLSDIDASALHSARQAEGHQ